MKIKKIGVRTVLLFVIIAVLIYFLLRLGFALFTFDDEPKSYMTVEEWTARNKPQTRIQELNWSAGVYEIFYIANEGLISQKSNGTDRKVIFRSDEIANFFLVENKIAIFSYSELIFINRDGSNPRVIFQRPLNESLSTPRLSIDKKKLAFALSYDSIPNVDKIYIVDTTTEKVEEINQQHFYIDKAESMLIDSFYWFKDSKRLVVRATYYVPLPTLSKIIEINVDIQQAKLLRSFNHSNIMREEINVKLANVIDLNELVVPEKINYDQYFYEKDSAVSPDNSKTAIFESPREIGTLTVNNEKIMQWDEFHPYVDVYQSPHWLPDNTHLVIGSVVDETIRIIDISSKKIAILDSGKNPKWERQKNQETLMEDWQ